MEQWQRSRTFDFAKKHNLKIGKIEDLIAYRLKKEKLIRLKKQSNIKVKIKNIRLEFMKIFWMDLNTLH